MGIGWISIGVVTALVAALIHLVRKTQRLKMIVDDQAEYLLDLQQTIKDIEAAEALTDQLRKDTAILSKDQEDISEDLRDAKGYSDPLPPDVSRVLDQLRTGGKTTRGSSK